MFLLPTRCRLPVWAVFDEMLIMLCLEENITQVLGWGSNSAGALGLGEAVQTVKVPTILNGPTLSGNTRVQPF